ncbi:unnamed protein product [Lymnaea stagnalis]|uniref:C-type lectin domain-containing protein n=1 Tax=Lymnaea stagnalis TaxID=6523 RepID=A0AAV2HAP7_LYMST
MHSYNEGVECLYHSTGAVPYLDARADCIARGAVLFMPKTRPRLDVFFYIAGVLKRQYTWIGLTDRAVEGTFVWEDGEPINGSTIKWAVGQPDNNLGIDDCCGTDDYVKYAGLNDYDCTSSAFYICQLGP